jgi:hypothetical protein
MLEDSPTWVRVLHLEIPLSPIAGRLPAGRTGHHVRQWTDPETT